MLTILLPLFFPLVTSSCAPICIQSIYYFVYGYLFPSEYKLCKSLGLCFVPSYMLSSRNMEVFRKYLLPKFMNAHYRHCLRLKKKRNELP